SVEDDELSFPLSPQPAAARTAATTIHAGRELTRLPSVPRGRAMAKTARGRDQLTIAGGRDRPPVPCRRLASFGGEVRNHAPSRSPPRVCPPRAHRSRRGPGPASPVARADAPGPPRPRGLHRDAGGPRPGRLPEAGAGDVRARPPAGRGR